MATPRRKEPERTCVGCRQPSGKRVLLRFVRAGDGSVRVDRTGRAQGRGAYTHRDDGCVRAAMRHGGLARALRTRLDGAAEATLMSDAMEAVSESA